MTLITTSIPRIARATFMEGEGGFYIDTFSKPDGRPYHLLVSPKDEGECGPLPWREMMAFYGGLSIGGKTDWQGADKLGGMAAFTLIGPRHATTPEIFKTGGAQALEEDWYGLGELYEFDADCAWIQSFNYGMQDIDGKGLHIRGRAFREIYL